MRNPLNTSNPPLTLLPPYEIMPLPASRTVVQRVVQLTLRPAVQDRNFRSFGQSGASARHPRRFPCVCLVYALNPTNSFSPSPAIGRWAGACGWRPRNRPSPPLLNLTQVFLASLPLCVSHTYPTPGQRGPCYGDSLRKGLAPPGIGRICTYPAGLECSSFPISLIFGIVISTASSHFYPEGCQRSTIASSQKSI